MSLARRIVLGSLLIALFGVGAVGAVSYYITSAAIEKMARGELEGLTAVTYNMVKQATTSAVVNRLRAVAEADRDLVAHFYGLAQSGAMTRAQAMREAEALLLRQKIGNSGYVYCLGTNGRLRVHPRQALVGTDLSRHEFAREQMRRRDGYLEYTWGNPEDDRPRPKALYMAYFAPWDWIISVTSYRDEFAGLADVKSFRDDVLSIKVGDTGYMFVLDGKGTARIHPNLEGQDMIDVLDARGRPLFREMSARRNGSIVYSWRNPGEAKARDKLAVFKYYPEYDWIIVGAAYLDELHEPLRRVRTAVAVLLVATSAVALALSLLMGRALGRSFSALEGVARRVASGDLRRQGTRGEGAAGPREIRAVERAFTGMARSLGKIVRGIAGISQEISGEAATVHASAQATVGASQRQLGAVTSVVTRLAEVSSSVESTHRSIAELNGAAEHGASSTKSLSLSLEGLLLGVTEFAAFVEQTSETMKGVFALATEIATHASDVTQAAEHSSASAGELERSIRAIDETTKASESLARAVAEKAHSGRSAVVESIEGMTKIGVTFEAIDGAVSSLGERVGAIREIVRVIEDISDQTKLLSLNASILAAQAGPQGRAFSVVADEIKRLSDRTNGATRQIAALIDTASQERERTSAAMAQGLSSVREGHRLADDAGRAIAAILDLTEQSHARMTQIAGATRAQVEGNRTILEAVAQIERMSRGVLEITGRQHLLAGEIKAGLDTVLTSLAAVRRSLEEQARGSKDVAKQIDTISHMSNAIRQDSDSQRAASLQMVHDIEVIRGSAAQILERAEQVAGSLSSLTAQVDGLNAAVAHFQVDPPGLPAAPGEERPPGGASPAVEPTA